MLAPEQKRQIICRYISSPILHHGVRRRPRVSFRSRLERICIRILSWVVRRELVIGCAIA